MTVGFGPCPVGGVMGLTAQRKKLFLSLLVLDLKYTLGIDLISKKRKPGFIYLFIFVSA